MTNKYNSHNIIGPVPSWRNELSFQNIVYKHGKFLPNASQIVIDFAIQQDTGKFYPLSYKYFKRLFRYYYNNLKFPVSLRQKANTDYTEKVEWLEKHVGAKGRKWQAQWSREEYEIYYIRFKDKMDAVRFKLVFNNG